MREVLKRAATDDVGGKLAFAVYVRMLGAYPDEAISYLTEQAIAKLTFFPTPAECLSILKGWHRRDDMARAHHLATMATQREYRARWDETRAALKARTMTQDEIDELPLKLQQVMHTECLLSQDVTVRYRYPRSLAATD